MTSSLSDLVLDVSTAIRSLAISMEGKPVEPQFVKEAFSQIGQPLPGHHIAIDHVARSSVGTRPKTYPHYVLTISGRRTDGRWLFRPSQLSKLLKLAQVDLGLV
jgi:hypothetical protein